MLDRTCSTSRLATLQLLPVLALVACYPASDDPIAQGQDDLPEANPAGRLGIVALAVAVGPGGSGVFDNFLPCVRRGVISYLDTEAGRQAVFSGCDLGGGVVVDGAGEIQWVDPALPDDRHVITRVVFVGSLSVVNGGEPDVVESFEVVPTGLMIDGVEPYPDRLKLASAEVTLDGETHVVDGSTVELVFDTAGMTVDSIPNPTGALSSLTEEDGERLAYHGGMSLLGLLLGESLESTRGPHSHELPCGTVDVTYVSGLAHITASWDGCEDAGLFFTGDFSLELRDATDSGMTFETSAPVTVGGGVPRISIESMRYTVSLLDETLPGRVLITMHVQGPEDALDLSFELTLSD